MKLKPKILTWNMWVRNLTVLPRPFEPQKSKAEKPHKSKLSSVISFSNFVLFWSKKRVFENSYLHFVMFSKLCSMNEIRTRQHLILVRDSKIDCDEEQWSFSLACKPIQSHLQLQKQFTLIFQFDGVEIPSQRFCLSYKLRQQNHIHTNAP